MKWSYGTMGRGRHRGGTTNGKTQVLGPRLHKHYKMFHRKNGKGDNIGTFLLYSLKVQDFKVQPSKLLFPIQNYGNSENTVMLHYFYFLKATS